MPHDITLNSLHFAQGMYVQGLHKKADFKLKNSYCRPICYSVVAGMLRALSGKLVTSTVSEVTERKVFPLKPFLRTELS